MSKCKTVVMNSFKMNYDGKLDMGVISDDITIYDSSETSQIVERASGAEVIITKELPVPKDVIAALPDSVKMICEAGTGYNNIDIEACREKGITVCNIPAYSSERVAHTAIMLLLNLSSCMGSQIRMLERKDRSNFTEHMKVSHVEVNGKTLGLLGAGNIGGEVAKVAVALGMKVLISKRNPGTDTENIKYVSFEEMIKNSDYISLHCPLSDATRHIIDEKVIGMMKPGVCIINTSRGPLIDEMALIKALNDGRVAGAGLDVQETEPPAQDNPLYDMDNVILTPHMGWKGFETRQRLVSIIADNVKAYEEGNPINVVS